MDFRSTKLSPLARYLHMVAGLTLAIIAWYVVPGEAFPKAPLAAGMVALMAYWWISECVPIPITSLLPLILMPALNLAPMSQVGANYGKPIIFLFLGGFLLAIALQKSGVHRRIALSIVIRIGTSPIKLILGFMAASAFLSMWISNTATVMVMLPIGLSLIREMGRQYKNELVHKRFSLALMLGLAYAADIGGMSTLIGTPPNLVFYQLYNNLEGIEPASFLQWMAFGVPFALVFLFVGWFLMVRVIFPLPRFSSRTTGGSLEKVWHSLGKIRRDEKITLILFTIAAILWMTGSDIPVGESFTISGWRSLTGLVMVHDAAVAVFCASILFILPSADRATETLLTWEDHKEVPWGILLLFGGGFAIAEAFEVSGLSQMIGESLLQILEINEYVLVATICTVLTFLTEITSNTAMANLILPILAKTSILMGLDPKLLMIPATLSASCAFMMPIASPTQAIVFGSGYIRIREMIKAGIWFNVLGIILVSVFFLSFGRFIFQIS